MRYKYLFFDLDGTLTASGEGIANAARYALEQMGIVENDREKLMKFVGPPLKETFPAFYGFNETETELAIKHFRVYYGEKGMYENRPYPGIEALLAKLRKKGYYTAIATSKLESVALSVVDHFDLHRYFDLVAGGTVDESRCDKASVLRYAMETAGVLDSPDNAVMIGDRKHDIIGAKANGIDSIGVLYGYGNRPELEAAGADYIVGTVAELEELLCGE